MCKVIDAANVNLKSFDEDIYRDLNAGKLEPILATLKTLKRKGVWLEVTNLVAPTNALGRVSSKARSSNGLAIA